MFADMADSQCEQEPSQRPGLAGGDGVKQVVGGFVSQSFAAQQVAFGKLIKVGHIRDQLQLQHLFDGAFAEAVDVHGAPGHEMLYRFAQARRAG